MSSQAKSATSRLSGPAATASVRQPRAIEDLHLAQPRDVVDREQRVDLDPGARLFPGFALGAVDRRLVELHIAGRQGPEAHARIDRAPAQEDAVLPSRDRADDDLRILVLDEAAIGTDETLAVVAFGDGAQAGAAGAGLGHAAKMVGRPPAGKRRRRGAAAGSGDDVDDRAARFDRGRAACRRSRAGRRRRGRGRCRRNRRFLGQPRRTLASRRRAPPGSWRGRPGRAARKGLDRARYRGECS